MRLWDVIDWVNSHISHYNHEKYGRYKQLLMDENATTIQRAWYLYCLKKCESYNNASLGNRINGGSYFKTVPFLPHGIKGIFVSDRAIIGENAIIYQQVTIGVNSPGGAPVIGDNVFIGTGAKILGDIHVGNNVKI